MEQVSHIYDRLFEFEKNKKQGDAYPIHKPLRFGELTREQEITDISDLILERIHLGENLKILDAGCGVGFTLLKLCMYPNIQGLGISLSSKELAKAQEVCHEQGLDKNCAFRLQSFDEALGETFDIILCVESLKHAPNWKNTLKNLVTHLNEGGSIFIVEDYFTPRQLSPIAKRFQKAWAVPDLFSLKSFEAHIQNLKLTIFDQVELDECIIKKSSAMSLFLANMASLFASLLPSKGKWKTLLQIYEGALLMDYLYAQQQFSYQLVQLQKETADILKK